MRLSVGLRADWLRGGHAKPQAADWGATGPHPNPSPEYRERGAGNEGSLTMIGALVLIPTLAGLASFLVHAVRVRRGLLVLTALRTRRSRVACGWIGPRSRRQANGSAWMTWGCCSLAWSACCSWPRRSTPGLSAARGRGPACRLQRHLSVRQRAGRRVHRLPAALPGLDDAGDGEPALRPAVGGGRSHDAGQRPLIYFHRHHRSLEATWKYLLICSVGIALALLGNFMLAAGATQRSRRRRSPSRCR